MHWCMDETLAVLAMIPFLGYFFRKLHIWWHTKIHHKCHEKGCDSEHVEHSEEKPECHPRDGQLTRGDILIICGWDAIHISDVEARYGDVAIDDLIGDDYLLDVDDGRPANDEFRWFVQDGQLRAVFQERIFSYDDGCLGENWHELSPDDITAELKAK